MSAGYDEPDGGEDAARLNRNLNELLQELRVAQTGVQILFAFLLSLPFTARFSDTTGTQRVTYFIALLAAAGATSMLIAPVAFHRLLFRRRRRPELIRSANRFAIAGLVLTVLGVSAGVHLVASYLLGGVGGWVIGGVTFAWFSMWWLLVPLVLRRSHPADADRSPAENPGDR